MTATPAKTGLALLRESFPPNQVSKLPKPRSRDAQKGHCEECGGYHGLPAVHLDYVGHAALTARLLDADPAWTWEPVGVEANGLPALDESGGLWVRLTVCGVTRLGYGDAQGKMGGDAMKERIGDALRNAAMRFGAALDLWHKGDLYAHLHDTEEAASSATTSVRQQWPDEAFAKRLSKFRTALDDGKTVQQLIEWAEQQGSLSMAQKAALRATADILIAKTSRDLADAALLIQQAPEPCRSALSTWAAERSAELGVPA